MDRVKLLEQLPTHRFPILVTVRDVGVIVKGVSLQELGPMIGYWVTVLLVAQTLDCTLFKTLHVRSGLSMTYGTDIDMDNYLHPANAHKQRCPRCQSPLNTVVVHGHEQCVVCKSNIFECCSGDTCDTDYNLSVGYKRG